MSEASRPNAGHSYPHRSWYRRVPFMSTAPRSSLFPSVPPDELPTLPERDAAWHSMLTFSWLTPLLMIGYTRPLEVDDLWQFDSHQRGARALAASVETAFGKRLAHTKMRTKQNTKNGDFLGLFKFKGATSKGENKPSLVKSCNDALFWWFWGGGLFRLLADVGIICGPLLVKAITNFATSSHAAKEANTAIPSLSSGVGMALGLFALQIFVLLLNAQAFHRSFTTGLLVRSALINLLFSHSLSLPPMASTTLTSQVAVTPAKLTSMISTDVSRIDFACAYFHYLVSAPVQMVICLALLISNLGWPAIPGFLVIVGLSPVQGIVTRRLFLLRKRSLKWTDKRIALLSEVFGNMSLVKMFAWEIPFSRRISEHRKEEMRHLFHRLLIRSVNNSLSFTLPTLAATISFITYSVVSKDGLDPAIIFSSLSLFNLLRQPLSFFPVALNSMADAMLGFNRIRDVLLMEKTQPLELRRDMEEKMAVRVVGADFTWDASPTGTPSSTATIDPGVKAIQKEGGSSGGDDLEKGGQIASQTPFRLRNINTSIPYGTVCAIVGPVGAGKSSLVQGLIGEMRREAGEVMLSDEVGYCPQVPWIQNASVRDNIIFGLPFDEKQYWNAVDAACLRMDIERLGSHGDLTIVGEKGVALSGGQRQRISIARAVYFKRPITILDDSFSALDANVGQDVFNKAIAGALDGTTRILVTHSLGLLPSVDHIVVMNEGVIIEQGSFQTLSKKGSTFARFLEDHHLGTNLTADDVVVEGDDPQSEATSQNDITKMTSETKPAVQGGTPNAMQVEERNVGSVTAAVYLQFISMAPIAVFGPLFILAAIFFQGGSVMNPYWLVFWQQRQFAISQGAYMGIYAALGVCQGIGLFFMGTVFALFTFVSSRRLHDNSLRRILHAPMSFFHSTPLGRIMNRFSKDIDTVDNLLGEAMRMFFGTVVQIIGAIALVSIVLPWFLAVVAVILLCYYWIAVFYKSSARELKRLDAVLRSSLYSHFSESLTGVATIRIYGVAKSFIEENARRIDNENRAYWLTIANQRWLSVRLDFLGACMVFAVAILAVVTRFSISPAQTGVALAYMLVVQQAFGWAVRQSAEVENNMNSVERLLHYAGSIEQEPPYSLPDHRPPPLWPQNGSISITNLSVRYRPGLPAVLKEISIEIEGGEHVALVGRTGAGKSTVTHALYRTVECFAGSIVIDGVDVSAIGLQDLRSAISIIPQDPSLFSGSIRYNLDPFGQYDDAHLNSCLKRVRLLDESHSPSPIVDASVGRETKEIEGDSDSGLNFVDSGRSTPTLVNSSNKLSLDFMVEQGGENLSIGQRSLVSLARAFAKGSKIMVLDEATASVDYETDRRIQASMNSCLQSTTLLCIAHRLRTVIGYDKIVVLDGGRVSETGDPVSLFSMGGAFRGLCERSGISLADIQSARQSRLTAKRSQ